MKHFVVFYGFFLKSVLRTPVTRHIGNQSAMTGPVIVTEEDQIVTKAIRAKSEKHDLPGHDFPEGRKEILDPPVGILSKWRHIPLVFRGLQRLVNTDV